jgi:hypothetical protein
MAQAMGWLDRRVTGYAEWLIRWRWIVVAVSVALALAAGAGGQFLGFSTNYRVFFSPQNPQLQAFESLQKVYIREDNITIVIRPHQGDVFQPDLLRDVRTLTEDAWQVPYTTRVDSIANFQNSTARGDDLVVEDLVPEDMRGGQHDRPCHRVHGLDRCLAGGDEPRIVGECRQDRRLAEQIRVLAGQRHHRKFR